MSRLLAVGLGGALGAVARYLVALAFQRRGGSSFPLATLTVNLVGCFLIGALMTWIVERPGLSESARLVLGVGFLGGLTTFSTFGMESVELLKAGDLRTFVLSLLGNVALGLVAVVGGIVVARAVLE